MTCKRKTGLLKEYRSGNKERALSGQLTTWCLQVKHHDETTGRWADTTCISCQVARNIDKIKSRAYQAGKPKYLRSRQLYAPAKTLQNSKN